MLTLKRQNETDDPTFFRKYMLRPEAHLLATQVPSGSSSCGIYQLDSSTLYAQIGIASGDAVLA